MSSPQSATIATVPIVGALTFGSQCDPANRPSSPTLAAIVALTHPPADVRGFISMRGRTHVTATLGPMRSSSRPREMGDCLRDNGRLLTWNPANANPVMATLPTTARNACRVPYASVTGHHRHRRNKVRRRPGIFSWNRDSTAAEVDVFGAWLKHFIKPSPGFSLAFAAARSNVPDASVTFGPATGAVSDGDDQAARES
jgi:hypothetical protein